MADDKTRKNEEMHKELDIKQIQEVSLEILHKVADLCEKLNLRYYLIYGTLIGAVRHHGFIPWDDDVDIMMPRSDYDRFLEYLRSNKLEHLSVFNHDSNSDYPYMITRISDDRYYIETENEDSVGMGLFIDIYPYDGLGNTKREALTYGFKGDLLSSLCFQSTRKYFTTANTSSVIKKVLKLPLYWVSKIIGKDRIMKKIESLQGKYDYENSKYIGCFVWLTGGDKDIFEREWFDEYEMCRFEHYSFRIPKQYDKVLRHTYGDYMKLPPEDERIGHHYYKSYKK